ncbi:glycosyltransferase family 2 protein [uncultured Aquimarina sp.]|uniref:glycosyltransferase family 2 protein n=1 Tax=uncultured Aquimarina sp. TaxID=575652 RepID=UPI0026390152|nr:glycosyltransferase family 2 protein [uncultured Aquimarina sp.]
MLDKVIRKINIGIYAAPQATKAMIDKSLASLNYGQFYAIHKLYLLTNTKTPAITSHMPFVQVLSEKQIATKASFFNQLISTTGVEAFLWIEAGVEITISQLLQMIVHFNHSPEQAILIPSLTPRLQQKKLIDTPLDALVTKSDIKYRFISLTDENPTYCYFVRKELVDEIGDADISYETEDYWVLDYNIRAHLKNKQAVVLTNICVTRIIKDSYCNQLNDKYSLKKKIQKLHSKNLSGIKTLKANCSWEKEYRKKNTSTIIHPDMVVLDESPLVSCIMPTANRAGYLEQSIRYFLEQEYQNKELIIVYNDLTDLPAKFPEAKNIHFIKTTEQSIGGKRNIACLHAGGKIIAQWDDDDLYGPKRLRVQITPIITGECEITALSNIPFFGLDDWSFWRCKDELHRQLFVENVAGGTLVFLKKVWEIAGPYPNTSLREDADFLMQGIEKNARLKKIEADNQYVYLRHSSNSWQFTLGNKPSPEGWIPCNEFELVIRNKAFYNQKRKLSETVSCIMPTYNRSQFVGEAIQRFLSQNYPFKELIIADDGNESIEHSIPDHPEIKYFRLTERMTIGAKRNFCCKKASGEIIVHWDDDDWYASDWLQHQVSALHSSGADICGLSQLYFYNPETQKAWKYQYPKEQKAWVAGATMSYKKKVWQHHQFQDINIGEDAVFAWQWGVNVKSHTYEKGFVATVHSANTSIKNTQDKRWYPVDNEVINSIMASNYTEMEKI